MHKVAILASAINCKYMRGTIRSDIRVGMRVRIVLKKDQRSGALTEGVVDILASDNHGDRRSLGLVRLWLREVGGERQGRILTEVNPARVLADEMMDRVPPLHERRGIWERLKSLFSRQPSDS